MASDIFMELISKTGSPIKGESTDAQFPMQIEIQTFSLRGPTFSRKKEKKAAEEDDGTDPKKKKKAKASTFSFSISKSVDKSTPILIQTYSKNVGINGEPFSRAIIRFRLPGAEGHLVFLAMIFTDVHLTKYDVEIDEETSIPGEKIDFAFKTLEMQYVPQDEAGAASKKMMTASWPPAGSA